MELTIEQLEQMIEKAVAAANAGKQGSENPETDQSPVIMPEQASEDLSKLDHGQVALAVGRTMRALVAGRGNAHAAMAHVKDVWGVSQNDVVVKMLIAGTDASGGFIVPEVVSDKFIDLLLPFAVVRNAMTVPAMPMPNGNMNINGGLTPPTASYIGEAAAIPASTATFRRIALSAKKLVGLVPISNDLLRFNSPSADAIVSRWLFRVIANREDLAFLRGDGVNNTPVGFRNIPGIYTAAITGATYLTVASDTSAMLLNMEEANLPMQNLHWFMAPRTKYFLADLVNTVTGMYPYKQEIEQGRFRNIPFSTTTQIPINLGGGANESELYLVAMDHVVIGDTMSVAMSFSSEASYVDAASVTRSAFQNDLTLLRAISEHDIDVEHAEAISVLTGVTWTP